MYSVTTTRRGNQADYTESLRHFWNTLVSLSFRHPVISLPSHYPLVSSVLSFRRRNRVDSGWDPHNSLLSSCSPREDQGDSGWGQRITLYIAYIFNFMFLICYILHIITFIDTFTLLSSHIFLFMFLSNGWIFV